jgi:hypothetical protein
MITKSEKAKGKKAAPYVDVSDDPVDKDDEDEDGDCGDDDDGVGDVEKAGELQAPKFGPPTGKQRTNHAIQDAGPSQSQPKPARKGRKPKISNGGKKTVLTAKETVNCDNQNLPEKPKPKRKAEVVLVGESPRKSQKTDTLRKSRRVAANAEVDETKKASHIIYDLKVIQLIFFRIDEDKRGPLRMMKAQIERNLAMKRKIQILTCQEMLQRKFLTLRQYITDIIVPQCLRGGISPTWSQN